MLNNYIRLGQYLASRLPKTQMVASIDRLSHRRLTRRMNKKINNSVLCDVLI